MKETISPVDVLVRWPFDQPDVDVWNSQGGDWQLRKKQWERLGIKSELGRGKNLTYGTHKYMSDGRRYPTMKGTSVFNPVISELVYQKWCPNNGQVIDPFAGGSVRGIVASVLGKKYWGCELRPEQVKANNAQLTPTTTGKHKPVWVCGDSYAELPGAPKADLMFSCPPYGNLERYSDDDADLSNLASYEAFLERYKAIIKRGCQRLKPGGHACFVVGSFRDDKTGALNDLQGDTVRAFQAVGMGCLERIAYMMPMGTAPIRAWPTLIKGHGKLVPLHQTVLVFIKP